MFFTINRQRPSVCGEIDCVAFSTTRFSTDRTVTFLVWIGFIRVNLVPYGLTVTTSVYLHSDALVSVVRDNPIECFVVIFLWQGLRASGDLDR